MIYNGSKDWEFRRAFYPDHATVVNNSEAKVFIYETAPVKKITGWMTIDNYIAPLMRHVFPEFNRGITIDDMWDYVKDKAGITRQEFDKYYKGCKLPVAWHIKFAYKFFDQVDPYVVQGWRPPQFYHNVDNDIIRQLQLLNKQY